MVAMHAAVGDSAWFSDERRTNDLIEGFAAGCRAAGAVWGGGETPTLRDIIDPRTVVLAGSAVGRIAPKSRRILGDVAEGDTIVFLASSGLQTNGFTLCRQLAERLPRGFETRLEDGSSYGEALLAPSAIYVDFVQECQRRDLKINYAVHITGHGWRKLMRLAEPFVYEIDQPGHPPPIFEFLMRAGPIAVREAYATFNMGIGFAVFVAPALTDEVVAAAAACGYQAWRAGRVRREGGRKSVFIPSFDLEYDSATLQVRGVS
jgi:phosphoribosylformylglycinamidine cyclo-ligase